MTFYRKVFYVMIIHMNTTWTRFLLLFGLINSDTVNAKNNKTATVTNQKPLKQNNNKETKKQVHSEIKIQTHNQAISSTFKALYFENRKITPSNLTDRIVKEYKQFSMDSKDVAEEHIIGVSIDEMMKAQQISLEQKAEIKEMLKKNMKSNPEFLNNQEQMNTMLDQQGREIANSIISSEILTKLIYVIIMVEDLSKKNNKVKALLDSKLNEIFPLFEETLSQQIKVLLSQAGTAGGKQNLDNEEIVKLNQKLDKQITQAIQGLKEILNLISSEYGKNPEFYILLSNEEKVFVDKIVADIEIHFNSQEVQQYCKLFFQVMLSNKLHTKMFKK